MVTASAAPSVPVKNRQLYIDGVWCDSSTGKKLAVENPATEETIAEVAFGGREDCRRAVAAAAEAMKSWMKLTPYDRAKVLKKTADLMRERADPIARTLTLEQGKPLAEAKGEVLHSADTFEWFAEEGKRAYGRIIPPRNVAKRHLTIKHPVGVVGTITPWNFPVALPSRKIAPALAAGCTVVSRPAEPDAADPDPDVRVPGRRRAAAGRRQPGDRLGRPSRRRLLRATRPSARSASPARPRSARS